MTCDRCTDKLCASKVPIFSNLSREELVEIIAMTGHRSYHKGESVFLEGTNAATLYLINVGKIKLYKYTKEGKEQILHILADGDFFGELNLLKEGTYGFYAEAMAETRVCTLTKDKLRNLILKRPEIGLKILEVVSERLLKLENLAQNLATNDVETRIAQLILDLSKENGRNIDRGIEIKLSLTREDMSNYIGVARETISRKLKKFQDEGIIEVIGNKKIILLDEERLKGHLSL
ncbi:Crp/Fnr family transcriptional regulator [Clostridium formicaceticum]|uniref:cAMP receptor protein n=1 Tax=Clostridium formicaceticum TaxID=1497 RepID=A0AAC9RP05_9CLOT|nr:Crp/Fnr family transcriptional regulator [Clostridium formicaceticum]ARE88683.1 cAMP receptor protein [Clostridium formicaceticum]